MDENEELVLVGDYNFVESSMDRNSNKLNTCDHECKQVWEKISSKANLIDTFRITNKSRRLYTYSSSSNSKSRIDRIYVPVNWQGKILSTSFENKNSSDHKIIRTKLVHQTQKGPGIYIFNNSLLEDPAFAQEIKNIIAEYASSINAYGSWLVLWDCLKMNISEFSKNY